MIPIVFGTAHKVLVLLTFAQLPLINTHLYPYFLYPSSECLDESGQTRLSRHCLEPESRVLAHIPRDAASCQ